jgi:hypothetical protein
MNELSTNPLQLDAADTQRSAGCAPTAGSRVPTREDGPIVDSSWDYDDDESDDDTTDLSDCGMIYDNAFGFECELSGSEQCEFCPNRAAIGRENS